MNIASEGKETFCTACIDDILIYSSTVNEVLEVLQKNVLQQSHKCVWGMDTVEYLGHKDRLLCQRLGHRL